MLCDTDLNCNYGSLVLTQFVQFFLHVTEDDRARRNAHTQRLIVGAQNIFMLPLYFHTHIK